MGYHSDLMIEMNKSPQLSGLDKFICAACVVDEALMGLVKDNLSVKSCSYCGEISENNELIAAPYDLIMGRVYETIFQHYGDAQDVDMPWVEKGWLRPDIDICEIIDEFDPGWPDIFRKDIAESNDPSVYLVNHVNNDWSIENRGSALSYGWTAFKEQVLFKTRYFFLNEPEDETSSGRPDYIPISKMVSALGELCNSENLIKEIPAGTEFYRVRVNNEQALYSVFSDVGAPPKGSASAGRMNAIGISYFYIAYDQLTAEKEVIDTSMKWTIAKFKTFKEITVVDFVELPIMPSCFSEDNYDAIQNLSFLDSLVIDLTLPSLKDGKEKLEYIPTQIISEYFRYRYKTKDNAHISGLRYPSVKNKSGINIAIFDSDNKSLEKLFKLVSIEKHF